MQGRIVFSVPGDTSTRVLDTHPTGCQRILEFILGALMSLEEHHLYAAVDAGLAVSRGFNCIKRRVGILRRGQALHTVGYGRTGQAAKWFDRKNQVGAAVLRYVHEFADLEETFATANVKVIMLVGQLGQVRNIGQMKAGNARCACK